MTIRLLGTGAADGIPSLFGTDEVSAYARLHRGKDIRTRTCALVDDELMIDLGPDTNAQCQRDGIDSGLWSGVIFTHSDDDHVQVNELQYGLFPFTSAEYLPFTIYGNRQVLDRIERRYPDWPMELVFSQSYHPFQHGKYRITPIRARHIETEDCQNLLIQADGRTIFYASDTGVPFEETFEFLQDIRVDTMVIECTDGFCPQPYDGHLDLEECVAVVDRLRKQGTLGDHSTIVSTHHSVRGKARHCDLERVLNPHGISVGYDGMVIQV